MKPGWTLFGLALLVGTWALSTADGPRWVAGGLAQTTVGNAPESILPAARGSSAAQPGSPTKVEVGLRIHQITSIDQTSENFGIVGDLQLRYQDPALALDAVECGCDSKQFHLDELIALAKERQVTWPETYYYNAQGHKFFDAQIAEIDIYGNIHYFERFTARFQAPDFDFRKYPFDTQSFSVSLVSYFPESQYIFEVRDEWSDLGHQLGEEEWVSSNFRSNVDTVNSHSRVAFTFEATRHATYYILRLFVPIAIIITVSWSIFFLGDYTKRIDIAMTNLLVFIAFNFVISGDLPRLGYLTFLDAILSSTFVVTGVIVVTNIALRRLEMNDRIDLARTIDHFVLWWYPIGYAAGVGAVALFYLT